MRGEVADKLADVGCLIACEEEDDVCWFRKEGGVYFWRENEDVVRHTGLSFLRYDDWYVASNVVPLHVWERA